MERYQTLRFWKNENINRKMRTENENVTKRVLIDYLLLLIDTNRL